MSNRKEFTVKTKKAAFARCCVDGVPRCEGVVMREGLLARCFADLRTRPFHYDHDDADFFSKDNSLGNAVVLCEPCHKEKTKTVDTPKISKARRIDKTRMKVKRRGPPMPGTKASGIRKRMNGTVERWR
jgi:5-methylcytosine-specific restriction protein A